MSCTAILYELSSTSPTIHIPLASASVQVVAVDQGTLRNLCVVQNNTPLTSLTSGVQLTFSLANLTYQVAVSDPTRVFAGFTVMNLNGNASGNLELVVHRLPSGGRAGSTATINTPAQARTAVVSNTIWTNAEKAGVLGLMIAYSSLLPSPDPVIQAFTLNYASTLDSLGIDPSVF